MPLVPRTTRGPAQRRFGTPCASPRATSTVIGLLLNGRGLLLDARISARHRAAGCRRGGADCNGHPRPGHAARRVARVRAGRRTQLRRPGLDRPARKHPEGMEGQSARPDPPRLRRHGLRHHDDAVSRRRRQTRDREPVSPRSARRASDSRDARDPPRSCRGLSEGFLRGDRSCGCRSRALPAVERDRARARHLRDPHAPRAPPQLARGAQRPRRHDHADRGRRARVSQARARVERIRNRRVCDAADQRRQAGRRLQPANGRQTEAASRTRASCSSLRPQS